MLFQKNLKLIFWEFPAHYSNLCRENFERMSQKLEAANFIRLVFEKMTQILQHRGFFHRVETLTASIVQTLHLYSKVSSILTLKATIADKNYSYICSPFFVLHPIFHAIFFSKRPIIAKILNSPLSQEVDIVLKVSFIKNFGTVDPIEIVKPIFCGSFLQKYSPSQYFEPKLCKFTKSCNWRVNAKSTQRGNEFIILKLFIEKILLMREFWRFCQNLNHWYHSVRTQMWRK